MNTTRKITIQERMQQRAGNLCARLENYAPVSFDLRAVSGQIFYNSGGESIRVGRITDAAIIEFLYQESFSNAIAIETVRRYCDALDISYIEGLVTGKKLSVNHIDALQAQAGVFAQMVTRLSEKVEN